QLCLILLVARILVLPRPRQEAILEFDWKLVAAAVIPPAAVSLITILVWRPEFAGPLAPVRLAIVAAFTPAAVLLFNAARQRPAKPRLLALIIGHTLVFLGIVLAYPNNPSTPHYNVLTSRSAPREDVFAAGNTLFLYDWPFRWDGRSGWVDAH